MRLESKIRPPATESDDDSDANQENINLLKKFDALNLILPSSVTQEKDQEATGLPDSLPLAIERAPLRGYETLQELRQKTAEYRKGYLNWRQFKPHGARGETTDVFTGKVDPTSAAKQEHSAISALAAVHHFPSRDSKRHSLNAAAAGPVTPGEALATALSRRSRSVRKRSIAEAAAIAGRKTSAAYEGSAAIKAERDRTQSVSYVPSSSLTRRSASTAPKIHTSDQKIGLEAPRRPSTANAVIEPSSLPKPDIRFGDEEVGKEVATPDSQKDGTETPPTVVPDTEETEVELPPKSAAEEHEWLRFYYNPFTPAEEPQAFPLCAAALSHIGEGGGDQLSVPTYSRDRSLVENWILHLGVGGFHRSHQLVYMDELLERQYGSHITSAANDGPVQRPVRPPLPTHSAHTAERVERLPSKTHAASATVVKSGRWGYCGVGLLEFDRKMADALKKQDLLYTVLSRSSTVNSARVVGSILDYVFGPEEFDKALAHLRDPKLRIVSLTVTEKGYCQNVLGHIDLDNALLLEDVKRLREPGTPAACPKTAIGFIYLGLRERRRLGIDPFTVMSCDNLPENGLVVSRMVMELANVLDPEFASWIAENVSFPSTMVDRITPLTGPEHRDILRRDFGITDEWPVTTEDYRQWVIEDVFRYGRPAWETVGCLLVADVRPFEDMKLRLLNGGHSAMCYLAYIADYRFVDDAVNDVKISSFLRSYMDELTSTIHNVSIELERYKEKIVERFSNRFIKDSLVRICEDGSTKFYNTLQCGLLELLNEDRHIHWACLGIACWIIFLITAPEEDIRDPKRNVLRDLATKVLATPLNTDSVARFLRVVFEESLSEQEKFVNEVSLAVFAVSHHSVHRVLQCGGALETIFAPHLASSGMLKQLLDFSSLSKQSIV